MAAQSAVFRFRGASGQTYAVSAYLNDTATALVTFDLAGKAGANSPNYFKCPETMVLQDVIIAAATGQTATQLLRDNKPTGDVLLNAVHLASVAFRPALNIPFLAGSLAQAVQLA
jgi:hypothetical protein